MDTYQRFCPIHREPLVAVPPVNAYPHKADEPWCAPELHCEAGTHLVGKACDVDSWLVVHVPTGLICYEANEDGARRVNSNVLIVEPGDKEPRHLGPQLDLNHFSRHQGDRAYYGDPLNRARLMTRVKDVA